MKRQGILCFTIFLATLTTAYAYPPTHQPHYTPIYREYQKQSLDDYRGKESKALDTYDQERGRQTDFQLYNSRKKPGTFTDFSERDARDPEFELYRNIESKYEKTPRFRY
ncbi:MAG TPA: hypothetical protein EYO33_27965 [Phycisphaerales bacterium]|nr:hypothetical protein [Phycisphaerales bacterium]